MKICMRTKIKSGFICLFSALTLIFSGMFTYAENVNRDLSGKLLRLHILANSDSEDDQELKLAVRDKIIAETAVLFKDAQNADDAARIAEENAALIQKIAEDEIISRGFDYPVSVNLESTRFPTKEYGKISLPRGEYRAVRVLIGDAKGKNWWCVMYPPLCFTNGVLDISDKSCEALRSAVGKEDYELITSDEPQIKIKFKIVELLNG